MVKNMKLRTKLMTSFFCIVVISLIIGFVGFRGMNEISGNLIEINNVRLPSIQSLLIISEAQTAIDSAENALLSTKLDKAERQDQYDRISDAWKRVDKAWKIYEPLPQTEKEAELWKKFVRVGKMEKRSRGICSAL